MFVANVHGFAVIAGMFLELGEETGGFEAGLSGFGVSETSLVSFEGIIIGQRAYRSRVPPWDRKFMLASLSKMLTDISWLDCWRRRASAQPAGPAPMIAILNAIGGADVALSLAWEASASNSFFKVRPRYFVGRHQRHVYARYGKWSC